MSLVDITKRAFASLLLAGTVSSAAAQSLNDTKFVYTENETINGKEYSNLHSVNFDGNDDRRLTENEWILYPRWSRDGSQIAYKRVVDKKSDGLYIMNSDGQFPHRIFEGNVGFLSWSPDDKEIAFVGKIDNTSSGIYVIDVNTKAVRKIIDGPTNESSPDWSPDGRQIAYSLARPVSASLIYYTLNIIDLQTLGIAPLTEGNVRDSSPRWSPKGDYVVFRRVGISDSQDADVCRINTDGSNFMIIGDPNSWKTDPSISPDGSKIAYRASGGGLENVFLSDPDGQNIQRLNFPSKVLGYYSLDWSPFLNQGISVQYTMEENYTIESRLEDGKQTFELRIANPDKIMDNHIRNITLIVDSDINATPRLDSFNIEYMTWHRDEGYSNWMPMVTEAGVNPDAIVLLNAYKAIPTILPDSNLDKPEEWLNYVNNVLGFLNKSRKGNFNPQRMNQSDWILAVPCEDLVPLGHGVLEAKYRIVGIRITYKSDSKNLPDFFFDYTVGQPPILPEFVVDFGKDRRAVEHINGQQPGFLELGGNVFYYSDEFRNVAYTILDRTNSVAVSSSGTASIGVPPANFVEKFLGVDTKLFIDNVTTLVKDTIFGSSKDVAEPASEPYHIGPDKTVFDPANPAKVTIAYEPAKVPAGQSRNLAVFTSESPEGPWETLDNIVVDESKNTVSGTANDLSYFFAGVQKTLPKYAAWDVNKDGTVNIVDLVMVARMFGTSGANLPEDVNKDGSVNIVDLVTVAKNFGQSGLLASPQIAMELNNLRMSASQKVRAYSAVKTLYEQGFDVAAYHLERAVDNAGLTGRISKSQLLANFPNPFNPETWIPYQLAQDASRVEVGVYSADGKLVRMFDLGERRKGVYADRNSALYWDGRNTLGEDVSAGLYYAQLRMFDGMRLVKTDTRRMLEVK